MAFKEHVVKCFTPLLNILIKSVVNCCLNLRFRPYFDSFSELSQSLLFLPLTAFNNKELSELSADC